MVVKLKSKFINKLYYDIYELTKFILTLFKISIFCKEGIKGFL